MKTHSIVQHAFTHIAVQATQASMLRLANWQGQEGGLKQPVRSHAVAPPFKQLLLVLRIRRMLYSRCQHDSTRRHVKVYCMRTCYMHYISPVPSLLSAEARLGTRMFTDFNEREVCSLYAQTGVDEGQTSSTPCPQELNATDMTH